MLSDANKLIDWLI